MRYLNTIIGIMILAVLVSAQNDNNLSNFITGPYLGMNPPGNTPELFAPDIIPTDGIQHCFPTFSPDGKEVFWMTVIFENEKPRGEIWYMIEDNGVWTAPAVAPFSGTYNDHNPVFSCDSKLLYFTSTRPGGVENCKSIWYVSRTESGWNNPVVLDSPPNTGIGAGQATFTSDGTVYFIGKIENVQWGSGIYRSKFVNDKYLDPEKLGIHINTEYADVYPFVAPDESYLLFGSSRPGGNSTETDLYISFRNADDTWGEPIHIDKSINNGHTVSFSYVSCDGKYLFFNRFDSDGTDKFYWVDAGIIDHYKILSHDNGRK